MLLAIICLWNYIKTGKAQGCLCFEYFFITGNRERVPNIFLIARHFEERKLDTWARDACVMHSHSCLLTESISLWKCHAMRLQPGNCGKALCSHVYFSVYDGHGFICRPSVWYSAELHILQYPSTLRGLIPFPRYSDIDIARNHMIGNILSREGRREKISLAVIFLLWGLCKSNIISTGPPATNT